jgi:Rrf2 family protein
MKISTKGRYGLRILLDLAIHDDGMPRLIRDIAESQEISEKYISRLIIDLRKAGMVRSIRGAKGGFRLARKPEQLTLLAIVEAMEGRLAIVNCVQTPETCSRNGDCATYEIWDQLNDQIRDAMSQITLRDIIENHRKRSAGAGYFDYCI